MMGLVLLASCAAVREQALLKSMMLSWQSSLSALAGGATAVDRQHMDEGEFLLAWPRVRVVVLAEIDRRELAGEIGHTVAEILREEVSQFDQSFQELP